MAPLKFSLHPFVSDADHPRFVARCEAALLKYRVPTRSQHDRNYCFGSALYAKNGSTYKGKLRAYLRFLLDNPYYDDSLLPFYRKTAVGNPCSAISISHFILWACTAPGQPVKELLTVDGDEVSNTYHILYCMIS